MGEVPGSTSVETGARPKEEGEGESGGITELAERARTQEKSG